MSNHTPGPWTWQKYADDVLVLVSETERIGTVRQPVDLHGDGRNADLIAAAPDMYEALKSIDKQGWNDYDTPSPIDLAMLALAKAEGRS